MAQIEQFPTYQQSIRGTESIKQRFLTIRFKQLTDAVARTITDEDQSQYEKFSKQWVKVRGLLHSQQTINEQEQKLAGGILYSMLKSKLAAEEIANSIHEISTKVPSITFPYALIDKLNAIVTETQDKKTKRIVQGLFEAFARNKDAERFIHAAEVFNFQKFGDRIARAAIKGDESTYEISPVTNLPVCKLGNTDAGFEKSIFKLFDTDSTSRKIFCAELAYALNHSFPVKKAAHMIKHALELVQQNSISQEFLAELQKTICEKPDMCNKLRTQHPDIMKSIEVFDKK
jgi:hypothetical protein